VAICTNSHEGLWWLFVRSVCWFYRRTGPVCTESECVSSCV